MKEQINRSFIGSHRGLAILALLVVAANLICGGCSYFNHTKDDDKENKRTTYQPLEERHVLNSEPQKPDHLDMAHKLIQRKHYDVALVQLREIETTNENKAEVQTLMGICYREEGELRKAEKAFQKAIDTEPEFAAAYNGLGITQYSAEKYDEAEQALKQAVELDPGRADYQNNLGQLYFKNDNLPLAEKHFRKSVTLAPGFSRAVNNLGFCLALEKKDDEALRTFLTDMTLGQACNNLGVAYESLNQHHKALAMYQKAVREDPNLKIAQLNTKRLISKLGLSENNNTGPVAEAPVINSITDQDIEKDVTVNTEKVMVENEKYM